VSHACQRSSLAGSQAVSHSAHCGIRATLLVCSRRGSLETKHLAGVSTSPVIQPLDPEVPLPEPDVADVEPLVTAVSSGTDNAEEATAAMAILRANTAHGRVVPEQLCAGVVEPSKQAATSPVSQDPALAAHLLQESENVVLGLLLRRKRRRRASGPWS